MPKLQRILIWLLISIEGLMLLFDIQQRGKYSNTISYFLQFEDEFLEMVADDVRYVIAFFLLLPLIAGDFLIIKLLAIVAYCMDIAIVENLYIRVDGNWQQIKTEEWLYFGIKVCILFFAFGALIMSILDEDPIPSQKAKKSIQPKVQNKSIGSLNEKTKVKKA